MSAVACFFCVGRFACWWVRERSCNVPLLPDLVLARAPPRACLCVLVRACACVRCLSSLPGSSRLLPLSFLVLSSSSPIPSPSLKTGRTLRGQRAGAPWSPCRCTSACSLRCLACRVCWFLLCRVPPRPLATQTRHGPERLKDGSAAWLRLRRLRLRSAQSIERTPVHRECVLVNDGRRRTLVGRVGRLFGRRIAPPSCRPFIARRASARTRASLCGRQSMRFARTARAAADEALVSLHDVHTFAKATC